jgi:hypothetical protein
MRGAGPRRQVAFPAGKPPETPRLWVDDDRLPRGYNRAARTEYAMATKRPKRNGRITRASAVLQVSLWVAIVLFAFFMQVMPFLLVLTMLNLAVGVTSGAALILIPAAAFCMLFIACWIATKRTRNMLPDPLPQRTYIAPYGAADGKAAAQSTYQRLIPMLQRWRWRGY